MDNGCVPGDGCSESLEILTTMQVVGATASCGGLNLILPEVPPTELHSYNEVGKEFDRILRKPLIAFHVGPSPVRTLPLLFLRHGPQSFIPGLPVMSIYVPVLDQALD